jgi:hypothetical protein
VTGDDLTLDRETWLAGAGGQTGNVLLGRGDGTFGPPRAFDVGVYPKSVAVGEFNGDDRPDLAVANCSPPGTAGLPDGWHKFFRRSIPDECQGAPVSEAKAQFYPPRMGGGAGGVGVVFPALGYGCLRCHDRSRLPSGETFLITGQSDSWQPAMRRPSNWRSCGERDFFQAV